MGGSRGTKQVLGVWDACLPHCPQMLEWAAVGLAMGQAAPSVKAKANYILPSIQEHGCSAIQSMVEELAAQHGP